MGAHALTDLRDLDDTQIWPATRSDAPERSVLTQLLLIHCRDEVGLVHKITGVLFRAGYSIVSNHEFVDASAKLFFMRTAFMGAPAANALVDELRTLLPDGAHVRVASTESRPIVVLRPPRPHRLWVLL